MQKLFGQPEQNRGDDPEGAVALGALVVAGGQAAELLAAGDQRSPPDGAAGKRAVEGPARGSRWPCADGVADTSPPAVLADGPTAVAFVPGHPAGAHAGAPAPGPLDRALRPATAGTPVPRGPGPG